MKNLITILLGGLVFVLLLHDQPCYAQQKRLENIPPKQQIEYLERNLSRCQDNISSCRASISSYQSVRKTEVYSLDSSRKSARSSSTASERERQVRYIEQSEARIRNYDNIIQRNQNELEGYLEAAQTIKLKIQEIKSETAAKMNERKIQIALEKQNNGEKDAVEEKSEYTHGQLTIPELKLNPQALKQWRSLQENERKCQYLIWEMRQVEEKYNESKETVSAVYDGGIPDRVADDAIRGLRTEYDKYNRTVKSSGNTIRLVAKKIEEEMKEKGENPDVFPKNEYMAWASSNGTSIIIAKFVSLGNSDVTLEAPNGEKRTLPLSLFWEEERKIFRQIHKEMANKAK